MVQDGGFTLLYSNVQKLQWGTVVYSNVQYKAKNPDIALDPLTVGTGTDGDARWHCGVVVETDGS